MTAIDKRQYRGVSNGVWFPNYVKSALLLCLCLSACGLHVPSGCHKAVRHAVYGRNECVIQTI